MTIGRHAATNRATADLPRIAYAWDPSVVGAASVDGNGIFRCNPTYGGVQLCSLNAAWSGTLTANADGHGNARMTMIAGNSSTLKSLQTGLADAKIRLGKFTAVVVYQCTSIATDGGAAGYVNNTTASQALVTLFQGNSTDRNTLSSNASAVVQINKRSKFGAGESTKYVTAGSNWFDTSIHCVFSQYDGTHAGNIFWLDNVLVPMTAILTGEPGSAAVRNYSLLLGHTNTNSNTFSGGFYYVELLDGLMTATGRAAKYTTLKARFPGLP